jgi:hypothetical protein
MIDTAGGKPPIGRTNYGSVYCLFFKCENTNWLLKLLDLYALCTHDKLQQN